MEHRILLELKNEDGCSVDSKGVKNKIEKLQNEAIKMIKGVMEY